MVKIKKKEDGLATVILCLIFIFFTVISFYLAITYRSVSMTKGKMDDGLTASALAALIIDMDIYTATGEVELHPQKSYDAFMETLKINLDLDDGMEANNPVYYKKIDVLDFIIYNVNGQDVREIRCNGGGFQSTLHEDGLGLITSANGEMITSSSVYIRLGITMDVFLMPDDRYVTTDNLLAVNFK